MSVYLTDQETERSSLISFDLVKGRAMPDQMASGGFCELGRRASCRAAPGARCPARSPAAPASRLRPARAQTQSAERPERGQGLWLLGEKQRGALFPSLSRGPRTTWAPRKHKGQKLPLLRRRRGMESVWNYSQGWPARITARTHLQSQWNRPRGEFRGVWQPPPSPPWCGG